MVQPSWNILGGAYEFGKFMFVPDSNIPIWVLSQYQKIKSIFCLWESECGQSVSK